MTILVPCNNPGECDHRTRFGKCYASLTNTEFGDRVCPFKHIDGLSAEKAARKLWRENVPVDRICEITGYTETQLRRVLNEQSR